MTARLPVNSLATEFLPPMGDYSASHVSVAWHEIYVGRADFAARTHRGWGRSAGGPKRTDVPVDIGQVLIAHLAQAEPGHGRPPLGTGKHQPFGLGHGLDGQAQV